MDVIRINMSHPNWWIVTYRSSFYGTLTLCGRRSFNPDCSREFWIGLDATLDSCSAVDHSARALTVFPTAEYCEVLSELAGLLRGDYEMIALMEILSLVRFLISRATHLSGLHICCVGDDQNVATWVRLRRMGNLTAK